MPLGFLELSLKASHPFFSASPLHFFHLPFHFNRVRQGLRKEDAEEKTEEISLQQLGASPLKETI